MGYVHDTHMAQYIPCTAMHYVTGTWSQAAGAVIDTIAMHKTAANETSTVNIPIMIPSNSSGQKGGKLTSIEVDYEILVAAVTSVTPVLYKVTRAADTSDAVPGSAIAQTMDLTAATTAATQDQHKATITITTPTWLDSDEYYLLEMTFVGGAGGATIDVLGAVANYTLRI